MQERDLGPVQALDAVQQGLATARRLTAQPFDVLEAVSGGESDAPCVPVGDPLGRDVRRHQARRSAPRVLHGGLRRLRPDDPGRLSLLHI